jgi:predicted dehydrogenase
MAQTQSTDPQETPGPGVSLAAAAVVGAGLALAAAGCSKSPPAEKTEAEPEAVPTILETPAPVINLALIGAGTQAQVLFDQIVKIQAVNVRFKAICDIWPYNRDLVVRKARAYKHETKGYGDYREMLQEEKGLDAVLVATPDWMHAEHTLACLEAGLHVYCEKEMSNDLAKAGQMVRAARKTGKLLQIGHQRRSNPRYLHCRDKLVREINLFGRLVHAYGQWNRGVFASNTRGMPKNVTIDPAILEKYGYDSPDHFRDWRWYKKYGGGPISDLGSHQIDIYGWFLGGRPKRLIASGGNDYWKGKTDYEWYDNAMALYEFDTPGGPARGYYQVLTTTSARGYYELFAGTEGALQISEDPKKCRLYSDAVVEKGRPHPWEPWVKKGYILPMDEVESMKPAEEDMAKYLGMYAAPTRPGFIPRVDVEKAYHTAHLLNFFNAVLGREKLNCPAEEAYETAVQVLKVNEAIATGQPVIFKEEDFKT